MESKKEFAKEITTSQIDEIHTRAIKAGSYGGKLSGAGGGGFFFEVIAKEKQKKLIQEFGHSRVLKIGYEPFGSRLLAQVM